MRALVVELTDTVVATLARRYGADHAPCRPIDLEEIQDQVELAQMRGGHAAVARAYILYREEHRRARAERADIGTPETGIPYGTRVVTVAGADGRPAPLDADRLRRRHRGLHRVGRRRSGGGAGRQWTLFSPDEVSDLVDQAFSARYAQYEAAADRGEIRIHRRVRAVELSRKG